MMPKVIFFDFDGVILESADIKTKAFRELFEKDCPERIDEIIKYYEENGGVSRYIKFDYVYENFLGKKLSEEKKAELGSLFTKMTLVEIERAPYVKGLLDFLEDYKDKIEFFIASGAPHDELNYLVDRRGLRKYFGGAYGAPKKKNQVISEELKKTNVATADALFVGDTLTDYSEARKADVRFIGIVGKNKESPFPKGTEITQDFNTMRNLIKEGENNGDK